jgi:seryl-tRNA synthetase
MKSSSLSLSSCAPCRRRILASFGIQPQPRPRSIRPYTRPSIAPKPVIDLKHIRQNPGLYEQNCIDRNYPGQSKNAWRIKALFEKWHALQLESRPLRQRLTVLHDLLPKSATKDELLNEAKEMQPALLAIEEQDKECQTQIQELAQELPNLSSTRTPTGSTPEVIGYINDHPDPTPSTSDRVWRSHVHIGTELDLLDFSGAATTSGWGWYYLKNEAALLEQALIQYALSIAMKRGWQIVSPPSMVYAHIADACGFQPRDQNGEQQIYFIEQSEKDKTKPQLVLAGTAEIPLAGMKSNTTFTPNDLPLKLVGVNRCYRAEAGARGADTKGLYRVHEFTKVELFAWTLPDQSSSDMATNETEAFAETHTSHASKLFTELVDIQTEILQSLGLHCRILEMPTTDLGASANRKIDIEAFFPSRINKDEGWGEVTSASICTDFQTRRLGTKVQVIEQGKKKLEYPFTINGTALAVPRVVAALLENGWEEEHQRITIPEVLRPWMGRAEWIENRKGGVL